MHNVEELQKNANVDMLQKLVAHYGKERAAGGIAASIAREAVKNYQKEKPEDLEKFCVDSVATIFSDESFASLLNSIGLYQKDVIDIYRKAIRNWKNRHDGVWYNGKLVKEAYPGTGRNEPCPCSSGKKYKKCCGR